MRIFLFVSLIAASAICLSSCGTSDNLISNQNQNQTSVVLSQNNYKIVSGATGTVKSTYVFGIGGLSKKSMRRNAMGEMMKSADLKGGARAVVNANVTEKLRMITPFYIQRVMVAEGTVIEFTK